MQGYVLENKLNISNAKELQSKEEKITKLKAIELKTNLDKIVNLNSLEALKYIHHYLFSEIYDFAGVYRDVNIAKDKFIFCLVRHLDIMSETINKMPNNTIKDLLIKYVEINLLHPFREGNGRSTIMARF